MQTARAATISSVGEQAPAGATMRFYMRFNLLLRLLQAAWEGGQQWIERLVEEEGVPADAVDNVCDTPKFLPKVALDKERNGRSC